MLYEVDNLPKKLKIEKLDAMVVFAYEYLSIPEDVYLEVQFSPLEYPTTGHCDYCDIMNVVEVVISGKLSLENIIKTFFHEMVHAMQMVFGYLVLGEGRQVSRWMGEEYSCSYEDLPWEQEAFLLEKEIFLEFMLTIPHK